MGVAISNFFSVIHIISSEKYYRILRYVCSGAIIDSYEETVP